MVTTHIDTPPPSTVNRVVGTVSGISDKVWLTILLAVAGACVTTAPVPESGIGVVSLMVAAFVMGSHKR